MTIQIGSVIHQDLHFFVCLSARTGIPYEDDDYREDNYDDERNDLREPRPHEYNSDGPMMPHHPNSYDMNRHTHFDIGGRNPYNYNRGPPFGIYGQQAQQPLAQQQLAQPAPVQSVQPQQPSSQQPQPQQPQPYASLDGGRGQYNGINPYAHNQYPYNGWTRPAYGWNRAPVSSGWSLGFPFNLFGFGNYRPGWGWGGNRFGLFF